MYLLLRALQISDWKSVPIVEGNSKRTTCSNYSYELKSGQKAVVVVVPHSHQKFAAWTHNGCGMTARSSLSYPQTCKRHRIQSSADRCNHTEENTMPSDNYATDKMKSMIVSRHLLWAARCRRDATSFQLLTSTKVRSDTIVFPLRSCFTMCCFAGVPFSLPLPLPGRANKSLIVSL